VLFYNHDKTKNEQTIASSIIYYICDTINVQSKIKSMNPGVFTKLYIQLVFSPMLYCPITSIQIQDRLFRYISGIVNKLGHKSLAVNGMYDHVHIFYSMKPNIDISETVKEIKRVSSVFLKEEHLFQKFQWQNGYGAFSYSKSHIDRVIKYIINQKEHHKSKTFRMEFLEYLKFFEIEYDPKYLFEFHE
jgi:putative transposase